jgi:type VI secretion system secreted protein Hcp
MSATIFMNFSEKKIKGDVTAKGYEDWIDLSACSFSVNRACEYRAGSGGSRNAQPAQISTVSMSRGFDMSSGPLFEQALFGKGEKIKVSYMKSGEGGEGDLQPYLELEFEDCLLTSFTVDGINESISVAFTKMRLRQYTTGANNQRKAPMVVGYDMLTATRW